MNNVQKVSGASRTFPKAVPGNCGFDGTVAVGKWILENKLHRELDNARVRTYAYDSTEVAGAQGASSHWINAAAGCVDNTDVADWVVAVRVVEQIEEIRTKLEARRFPNWPTLQH